MLKLSIVVVSYNTADGTADCIASLQQYGLPKAQQEIIVVDNASTDGTASQLRQRFPDITVLAMTENLGFAKGCNRGAAQATGSYLAFINSDCRAHPHVLEKLAAYLDGHADVAVVVPKLVEAGGTTQPNVARLPTLGSLIDEYLFGRLSAQYPIDQLHDPTPVEAFSGAVFVIRAEVYRAIGGFDERYFMYVEDVELGYQLGQAGHTAMFLPSVTMTHAGGGSSHHDRRRLNRMLQQNRLDYVQRHFSPVQGWLASIVIRVGIGIMKLKHAIKP